MASCNTESISKMCKTPDCKDNCAVQYGTDSVFCNKDWVEDACYSAEASVNVNACWCPSITPAPTPASELKWKCSFATGDPKCIISKDDDAWMSESKCHEICYPPTPVPTPAHQHLLHRLPPHQ